MLERSGFIFLNEILFLKPVFKQMIWGGNRMAAEYGYNIPATCQKVQAKVKNAIENMTGLNVEYVNVRIVTIQMQNR